MPSLSRAVVALVAVGVLAVIVQFLVNPSTFSKPSFPTCESESASLFAEQLAAYPGQPAGYKEIRGECAFAQSYKDARSKFIKASMNAGLSTKPYPVVSEQNLFTDVAILKGSPDKFLLSVSGIHGPEGFAGSAIQNSLLQYLGDKDSDLRKRYEVQYKEPAEGGGERIALPIEEPTIVFIHAVNPYGFANNRRFNEDNIDVNRNFLTDEQFEMVTTREPNFAGYETVDFMINPKGMPTSNLAINDVYVLARTAFAVIRYGIPFIKRALVAGNYFKKEGLGFGGFGRSKSVENMIQISRELGLHQAKKVILLDHHTGLGPSGTDTLAALGSKKADFADVMATIDKTFPDEFDKENNQIVGGAKASDAEGSAMSGYDLTMGTTDFFCESWMSPHLSGTDRLCITQEFGTVDVVAVGRAQMNENFAHHYGSDEQKKVYGDRLKGVFYVETKEWMRNVAHRGVTVFFQALQLIRE